MKRFIDLRGQHTLHRFAWWCTVRDEFEGWYGDFAWNTWDEFAESAALAALPLPHGDLEHYKRLCPAWAFEPDPDDDYETDTVHPT